MKRCAQSGDTRLGLSREYKDVSGFSLNEKANGIIYRHIGSLMNSLEETVKEFSAEHSGTRLNLFGKRFPVDFYCTFLNYKTGSSHDTPDKMNVEQLATRDARTAASVRYLEDRKRRGAHRRTLHADTYTSYMTAGKRRLKGYERQIFNRWEPDESKLVTFHRNFDREEQRKVSVLDEDEEQLELFQFID